MRRNVSEKAGTMDTDKKLASGEQILAIMAAIIFGAGNTSGADKIKAAVDGAEGLVKEITRRRTSA
jgi:hypothetical protein